MLSIADLDQMAPSAFADALGGLFEASPWVAAAVAQQRPFGTLTHLHEAMVAAVAAAGVDRQRALICAHPDLAGRAARDGGLTAESTAEQASAGLDRLSAEEFARFTALNTAYRERFGFPFILAVKGADKHRILDAFAARLQNDAETEWRTALAEIAKIAWLRLLDQVRHAPTGKLTTHVLDTARGQPAAGLRLALYQQGDGAGRAPLVNARTNADGRLDAPLLAGAALLAGRYELVFEAGAYFAAAGLATAAPAFLDQVALRFAIANPEQHWHVPLLLSPWSYSTYRGS